MQLDAAPLYAEPAPGAPAGAAYWLQTEDGLRIRIGVWQPEQAQGTVLLFPGRTEYVEKYNDAAAELARRGFATVSIDWRGQGLADRMLDDRRVGHIVDFVDYQADVAAVVQAVDTLGLPRPFHLIGHSMGGAIGLRAVMDGNVDVVSSVFTGPMWGISLMPPVRLAAWVLPKAARLIGQEHRLTPGTRPENYVEFGDFDDNTLTSDRAMFDLMRVQLERQPDLSLGGPSLHWLREALDETDTLSQRPSPDLPCICFVGDNERIVDIPRARDRMRRWPGGELEMLPGCEHEVMMETPQTRQHVYDRMADLFRSAS
ncbi:MAG: alpha/beta hydrolase [Marinibacterium sp.]|nr:alpha/beta hydrolase [Marinibacterium sp.]